MNQDPKKQIGMRINQLLATHGKKQKDLAAVLGVKDNIISYYCSGERVPNYKQLVLIADYFKTTTDYLLGRTRAQSINPLISTWTDFLGLDERTLWNIHCHMDGEEEDNEAYSAFIKDIETTNNHYNRYRFFDDLRSDPERVYPWDIVNYLLCNRDFYLIADYLCNAFNYLNDALSQIKQCRKAGTLDYTEENFHNYELFLFRVSRLVNNISKDLFFSLEDAYNDVQRELSLIGFSVNEEFEDFKKQIKEKTEEKQ